MLQVCAVLWQVCSTCTCWCTFPPCRYVLCVLTGMFNMYMSVYISPLQICAVCCDRCVQHERVGGLAVLHRQPAGGAEQHGQGGRVALHDAALAGQSQPNQHASWPGVGETVWNHRYFAKNMFEPGTLYLLSDQWGVEQTWSQVYLPPPPPSPECRWWSKI